MSEHGSGYKHDSSDKKLDQSAEAANESGQTSDTQHSSGAGHKTDQTSKHDDAADVKDPAPGTQPATDRIQ